MNKKLIRLTESDIHRIVKESVDKMIKEGLQEIDTVKNYDPTEDPFDNYCFPHYKGKCPEELWLAVKDAITFAQTTREKINDMHTYGVDTSKLGNLVIQLETELETTMHHLNVMGR